MDTSGRLTVPLDLTSADKTTAAERRGAGLGSGVTSPDGLAELCSKAPLARTLYEHFRERIMAGEYGVGSRLPTVRVVADPVLPAQADGDAAGHSPIAIEILPRALKVLAPTHV